ncbi:MAG TPA: proline dehydrogenase family protein [Bacteroidota bacterium]
MNPLNKLIVSTLPFVPKSIVGRFASRYIAGESFTDASHVVRKLNAGGMMATIDLLGEDISRREEAIAARESCKNVLDAIKGGQLDSNLSVKLTQLGLKLDKQFCSENLLEILDVARSHGNFVRIDMEDSSCTDDTLEIYCTARKSYSNVGVVIQASMRRSESDLAELIREKANVRLCKGIYVEPEEVAFQRREEVQENFVTLLGMLLRNQCYVGIATHDERLIEAAYGLIRSEKLGREEYEFQMLLGVRHDLRKAVAQRGNRMRVYVPFGAHWYAYSLRRLKENPQIAWYILRSILTLDHSD